MLGRIKQWRAYTQSASGGGGDVLSVGGLKTVIDGLCPVVCSAYRRCLRVSCRSVASSLVSTCTCVVPPIVHTAMPARTNRAVPTLLWHGHPVVSVSAYLSRWTMWSRVPGTTSNVIPDTALLKGTIRDVNPDVGATLLRRLHEVVHGVAAAFEMTADVTGTRQAVRCTPPCTTATTACTPVPAAASSTCSP